MLELMLALRGQNALLGIKPRGCFYTSFKGPAKPALNMPGGLFTLRGFVSTIPMFLADILGRQH